MASPRELRAAIIDNRAQLQSALHGAHAKWETKPGSSEGEENWSPKQVVDHMIGSEWFFTNQISQACGAPAIERPQIDVSSPAAAAASATHVGATCDNILRHVSDGDMTKTRDLGGLGTQNVGAMLEIIVGHAKEHLNQLEAASS